MTRHIIALGHQRIGFIIGNPNQTASARRLAGFRDAMAAAGLDGARRARRAGHVQLSLGPRRRRDAARPSPIRPSAIFASNDDMAAATVAIAHRRGLDVPGDLTVAGFDDTALATTIWPELTTVRQPITDMARAAVELLVRRSARRRSGAPDAPRHISARFQARPPPVRRRAAPSPFGHRRHAS